jgi:hypothetical protein
MRPRGRCSKQTDRIGYESSEQLDVEPASCNRLPGGCRRAQRAYDHAFSIGLGATGDYVLPAGIVPFPRADLRPVATACCC